MIDEHGDGGGGERGVEDVVSREGVPQHSWFKRKLSRPESHTYMGDKIVQIVASLSPDCHSISCVPVSTSRGLHPQVLT